MEDLRNLMSHLPEMMAKEDSKKKNWELNLTNLKGQIGRMDTKFSIKLKDEYEKYSISSNQSSVPWEKAVGDLEFFMESAKNQITFFEKKGYQRGDIGELENLIAEAKEQEKSLETLHNNKLSTKKKTRYDAEKEQKYLLDYFKYYCSIFPNGFKFQRKWMIRLWLADGVLEDRKYGIVEKSSSSSERKHKTAEELAQEYFDKLVSLGKLQELKNTNIGECDSKQRYQICNDVGGNDVLQCEQKKFGTLVNDSTLGTLNQETRRLFVQMCRRNPSGTISLRKLGSFFMTFHPGSVSGLLSEFRILRVLCLRNSGVQSVPDSMYGLLLLHYLDLSFTHIKHISENLKNLTQLKTLDLRDTLVTNLPAGTTKLGGLQHLLVGYTDSDEIPFRTFDNTIPSTVPDNLCSCLEALQTLRKIKATFGLLENLDRLVNLRNFFIMGVESNMMEDLLNSIEKMEHLTTLGIAANSNYVVLKFPEEQSNSVGKGPLRSNLEKLSLMCKLEGGAFPSIFLDCQNLKNLDMGWSGLNNETVLDLFKISSLVHLTLRNAFVGDELIFTSDKFPNLKTLHLVDLENLTEIKIRKRAMATLVHVGLTGLKKLKVPTGILGLPALEVIYLRDMEAEFTTELRTKIMQAEFTTELRTKIPSSSKKIYIWSVGESRYK